MQANAAEMMRLAACFATESGIEVCAPVHDAFLICAPLERFDGDIAWIAQQWRKPHGPCSPDLKFAPMCTVSTTQTATWMRGAW